jgi:hypothetical protein
VPTVVHTTAANASPVTIPATAAGNCLIVCIMSSGNAAATVSGVTLGGAADNFAAVVSGQGTDGITQWADAFQWADPNCAGGQTSVAISGTNLGFASGVGGIVVYEVSGLATSPADQTNNGGAASGLNWTSNTTPTTTAASEIWVGCAAVPPTITGPGAPWTNTTAGTAAIAGEQIVTATGTATYNGSTSTSNAPNAAVVATYTAATTAAAGTQPRATVAVPRRRPARGQWRGISAPGPVTVRAQQRPRIPRRALARALWRQAAGTIPCVQLLNSFEGGTSGVTLTPGNSGGASGNAFDATTITGTGVLAFDNTHAAHGSLALKAQAVTSGDAAAANWTSSLGMHSQLWFREYLYFTANPTANCRVFSYLLAAANCATVSVNSAGQLVMLSSNAVTMFTFAAAIPLNQWFRIEGTVFNAPATGQGTLRLYTSPDSVTPAESHTSAANFNTLGSGNAADFGIAFSAAILGPYWIDDVGISTCGFLGPAFTLAPAQQYRPVPRRTLARAYVRFTPAATTNAAPPAAGGGPPRGADSDRPWLKRRRVKWYRHGPALDSWYGAEIPAGVGSAYAAGRGLADTWPDDADTALPGQDTERAEIPDASGQPDRRLRRRANLGERIRGSNRAGRPVWTRNPVVPAAGGTFDQQRSVRLVNSYRLPRPGWRSAREYPLPVVQRRE